jgi:HSF-type DNA-binding
MSSNTNTHGSDSSGSGNKVINNADNQIKMVIDKPNQFPWKLYDMLDSAERRGEEHIISWIRDGTAFKVHNRDVFIEEYMKKQFNQTKFKSFQRQCKYAHMVDSFSNLWWKHSCVGAHECLLLLRLPPLSK